MPSVRSMLSAARGLALDVEALLLPVVCLSCERACAQGAQDAQDAQVLCDECRLLLRPIAPPRCQRCGQTRDRWEGEACGFCGGWSDCLARTASAVWYQEGPAKRLVQALKYGGWTVAAGPMARVMLRECGPALRAADVLVPVPLGRRRLRERGHNQAEVLARAIAARSGLVVAAEALSRRRETRTQTALDPRARRANVAGAFVVRTSSDVVRRKRVLLIDDVLTTGATLVAAAEALAAAGAAEVSAVTFARAPKPE